MGYGVSVVGVDAAGGTILGGGQPTWNLEGALIALKGDAVAGHGKSPHAGPSMAQGSSWFTIDGIGVVRAGHLATCGHSASGRGWFTIPD